jgi:uncharacterized membrane protein
MKEFLQGRWMGHPLHALLVHVPTAVWPAAMIMDLLALAGVSPEALAATSYYAILFGLVVAVLAVPAGLADWIDIKPTNPARKLGLYHMGLNLTIAVLWALSLAWRASLPEGSAVPVPVGAVVLGMLANALLLVSGYLGGRMVYAYGISVARAPQAKTKWRQAAEAGGARLPKES